ncbi:unnamed protein product [Caenorhabditis sp. 36 PRJEB53466]|nr:unnamed protein product [Caenorhabditis sp. 36 PRJEB53466]
MTCYRHDLKRENQVEKPNDTPDTFWTIVEHFTEMQDSLMKLAGNLIVHDPPSQIFKFLFFGVFRKNALFFAAFAGYYLYWLIYTDYKFREKRNDFLAFVNEYRGFYLRKAGMFIYFVFICLTLWYAHDTLRWVRNYRSVYDLRETRFDQFLKEYDEVINSTAERFLCYENELPSVADAFQPLHTRIRQYHLQNIPPAQSIINNILDVIDSFKKECLGVNMTCGKEDNVLSLANSTLPKNLADDIVAIDTDVLFEWDSLTDGFEQIIANVMETDNKFERYKEAIRGKDRQMEVIGKLNVTSTLNDSKVNYFNMRDVLLARNVTVQDFISLNPREFLENHLSVTIQIGEWETQIKEEILKSERVCSHLFSITNNFCAGTEKLLTVYKGKWSETMKSRMETVKKVCQLSKQGCFFCKFKLEVENAVKLAETFEMNRLSVANRTGDDFGGLRDLHEKYRMQMWSDYVLPLAFLEVPSIILLLTLYVLNFMMMASVLMVETDNPDNSCATQTAYYQRHTTEQGLYWYNY